jgi:hypothetical protein
MPRCDGAGAMVVAGGSTREGAGRGPRIVDARSLLFPETKEAAARA